MLGLESSAEGLLVARDGRLKSAPAASVDAQRAAWVAVGLDQDAAAMGTQLRELRVGGYAVQGFVDRTVALVGAQRLAGAHIALNLAPAQTLLAVAFNDGATAELQRTVRIAGGQARLIDAWLALAARTLVQQTRFDPLHDQRCEQALRAALPQLAAAAERTGQAEYRVQGADRELPLVLTRDQLAAAAASHLAPVAAALQALAAASPECGLLVDERFAGLPGISGLLDCARGAQVRVVPPGSAACAASLLPEAAPLQSGGVQYLRRVPLPGSADLEPLPLLAGAREDGRPMATHVVYRGRAIAIDGRGLVIGRDPGDGEKGLVLPGGVAGLSRRHCTLRRERGRTQIVDHSRYGSFLDGARVRGRAFLSAGSTLRLGTPGVELPLVALQGS
ncbi:MAG TPA: FHA domain-containing protein [Steroidobacteraceae bacterium]|nr:FHA domain-containing protein [Steroidobacteraceae bacterium]